MSSASERSSPETSPPFASANVSSVVMPALSGRLTLDRTVDSLTGVSRGRCDEAYDTLLRKYSTSQQPIEVNFRELVLLRSGADRATHLFHSYPAKLLINIPYFFLSCSPLSALQGRVLDPFCGTGTVLVEGLLAGRAVIGADSNPLARLISRAKTRTLDLHRVYASYEAITKNFRQLKPIEFTPVVKVSHWFSEDTIAELGKLLAAIKLIDDLPTREFFEVCFSSCVKKVSFADPRLSVPVRLPMDQDMETNVHLRLWEVFERTVFINARRIQSLFGISHELLNTVEIKDDARFLADPGISSKDVSLIITSPPYAGAQKYIRSSSLSIGWLGLAPQHKLRNLERQNIGREHFAKFEYRELQANNLTYAESDIREIYKINPLRAHIVATYLSEMTDAFSASVSRLMPMGHLVLVIGDNQICGSPFPTSKYVRMILQNLGLRLELELVDDIRSRGLMTKRNKTAGIIDREHIFVFQKIR